MHLEYVYIMMDPGVFMYFQEDPVQTICHF